MNRTWLLLVFALKGILSIKEWPNCVDFATIDAGDMLESGGIYSYEACAQECDSRSSCHLWAYKNYTCNLFSKGSNLKINKGGNDTNMGCLYGFRECSPKAEEHWPECKVQGFDLKYPDLFQSKERKALNIQDCSWYCAMNRNTCRFWYWDGNDNLCYHKSTFGPPQNSFTKESAYGSNKCTGKILEYSNESFPSVHGGWSPWSKEETPCFNKHFGDLVKCGGGLQYRRRSCTNPVPRYGGRICMGKHLEAFPCNTHHCQVPKPWQWSEWSKPKDPCGKEILQRESLCGVLRHKLESGEEYHSNLNIINWPTCLFQYENHGVERISRSMASLKECFNACSLASPEDCLYWSYDFKFKKCRFYFNFKLSERQSMSVLSGNRNCRNEEIPPPFCGVMNKVSHSDGLLILKEIILQDFNQCFELCKNNVECHRWLIKTSNQDVQVVHCVLYGNMTSGSVDNTKKYLLDLSNYTSWTGKKEDCISEVKPRIPFPELYEDLALIGPCQKSERKKMMKEVNFWNKSTCPSPCKEAHTLCPKNSDCLDKSTEEMPFYECVCQLGLIMKNGICRVASIENSAKIKDSEFEDSIILHYKVIVVGRVLLILILVMSFVLGLIYSKQFRNAGLYHRTIEITLVLANAVTLLNILSITKDVCRVVSILAHFLWTGVFSFLALEAIHIYGLICNIVLKYGIFSKTTNFVTGWALSSGIVIISICFEYENYMGDLTCWMNYGSSLIYAQILPNLLISIAGLIIIEASDSVNKEVTLLPGTNKAHIKEAKWMHSTLIHRIILIFMSFSLGSLGEYTQDFWLLLFMSVFNVFLGLLVLWCQVLSRDKINDILRNGCKRLLEMILRRPRN